MKLAYLHLPITTSTNDYAKSHLSIKSLGLFTIISTDLQTNGRGTSSRQWLSSKNDLAFSVCFFMPKNTVDPLWLTALTSQIMKKILLCYGINSTIKKPNDLFINGKKIAGILTETISHNDQTLVIIGIGLNVNSSATFLETISQPATSIFNETNVMTDCKNLLYTITQQLHAEITSIKKES
ncbi:Uncharacterized protein CLAVI_000142 [Candidatus Clavichlamydia salmonicola]|uniref:biotin--[acetyl-CoA-carboxylase] ligase n=1 Tax=Candidatus Clavichlamydia salmonicola TaxID=469812 RepID=UPI0018912F8A|nr:biotin--[acetyl-CoA-carboxylase] ligase [Candidatus Clavichlamydia salmonicola]MBF5050532.1 Uncharacterized protein [Candidatus Clavichlamydia salmonicola]